MCYNVLGNLGFSKQAVSDVQKNVRVLNADLCGV